MEKNNFTDCNDCSDMADEDYLAAVERQRLELSGAVEHFFFCRVINYKICFRRKYTCIYRLTVSLIAGQQ